MAMTKQQRDYAVEQVVALRRSAVCTIEEKHPIPTRKRLTTDDLVRLVRTGKVKMYPENETRNISGTVYLRELFNFEPIEAKIAKDDKAVTAKAYKAINKETAPIRKEAARIIDQIMLGDSAEALKLIESFAKMCK